MNSTETLAWKVGLAKLRGRTTRKLASGTYAQLRDGGAIAVCYRGTDVVTFHEDGDVTLNHDGWPSVTTLRRMNDALSGAWYLTVDGSTLRRGVMPKNVRPWTVETTQQWVDEGITVGEFVDKFGAVAPRVAGTGWGSNMAGVLPQTVRLSAATLANFARPVLRFAVTVKHDNGTMRIVIMAADDIKAREIVARSEGLKAFSAAIISVELDT